MKKRHLIMFFAWVFVSATGLAQKEEVPAGPIKATTHEEGKGALGSNELNLMGNHRINTLPVIAHLDGVGSVAGIAFQTKLANEKEVLVALAAGDAKGFVVSVSKINVGGRKLSLLSAVVQDATLKTQYGRGTDLGAEYSQSLNGFAQLATLNTQINQLQHWYANVGLSLVSLQGYQNADGDVIKINQAGLHDVFTLSSALGFTYDERGSQLLGGNIKAGLEVASLLFRPGQSDQGQINYHMSWMWKVSENTNFTSYLRGSHGFVLAKKTDYDDLSEVISEIDGQCGTLQNPVDQLGCFQLEQDLANYIVASNKQGAAQPLGGAYGLRSYSEQYIKAANTLLEGAEVSYQLPWLKTPENSIELIAFGEIGQASDDLETLVDNTLHSYGAGLRLNANGVPVRLEMAKGSDDTRAWYLTVGKRW